MSPVQRISFPGISHQSFQHPLDRQALSAMEKMPFLPTVVRTLSSAVSERFIRVEKVSSSLRVGAEQYPSIYRRYVEMAQTIDVRKLPSLFIETSHMINAYAMGMEDYTIVVTSSLADLMNEQELMAVVAHELGHIKCDHMLYTTLANTLKLFGAQILIEAVPAIPGARIAAQAAIKGIQLAILEWNRKAELSCDRAALLAMQEIEPVTNMLAKLAGFSRHLSEEFSADAVIQQAEEYQEIGGQSLIDKLIKIAVLIEEKHPYPVVRVREVNVWANSDEYKNILAGNYQRMMPISNQHSLQPVPISTPTAVLCPGCAHIWEAGTIFCPVDGVNLRNAQLICGNPDCRIPVDVSWSTCPRCGRRLVP